MQAKHEKELLNKIQEKLHPLFNDYHKVYFIGIGFKIIGREIFMFLFLKSHEQVYLYEIYTSILSRLTYCKEKLLNENIDLNDLEKRLEGFNFITPTQKLEINAKFNLENIELIDNHDNLILDFAYGACFTKDGRDKGLIKDDSFKNIKKIIKDYLE